ncbi:MAG: hypothetical protein LBQ05_02260, partial [Christensenellaceae bacterium]|nr:hypothetical protein [Christensenellaceae bacterium]
NPQGGFGGVGVENWVLQNGGSLVTAIKSFLDAANGKSLAEFQKAYPIWDFGENYLAKKNGKYPHDNFVNNLNEAGFQKMRETLTQTLSQLQSQTQSQPKLQTQAQPTSQPPTQRQSQAQPTSQPPTNAHAQSQNLSHPQSQPSAASQNLPNPTNATNQNSAGKLTAFNPKMIR